MQRPPKTIFWCILAGLVLLLAAVPALAQQQTPAGPASPPATEYKMTTPMPPGIACPDKVETRLGTLNFFDGFPDKPSVEKLYDNLDFQRAVQAYLLALPPVSQAANRNAIRELGPANTTVPIFEQLMDSRSIFLTANDNTVYSWTWLDLRNGPLVVEVPPKVLGAINDMWYRWVIDVGITGPDKGKGGKYLLLPPGYKGKVPKGYIVVRPPTFSNWIPWRSFLVDGDPKPGVDLVKKFTRIYPLSQAGKSAADEVRGPLRQVFQHGRPGGLHVLGVTQSGRAGGAERFPRPGQARLLCLHRHPEGQALRTGRADEEDPDRGRRGGRRHRPGRRLQDPAEGGLLL